MAEKPRTPSIAISLLPVVTLVIMLAVAIYIFRGDSLGGASQIVLLIATSICSLIAVFHCKIKWEDIEGQIARNIYGIAPSVIILLLIGTLIGQLDGKRNRAVLDLLWVASHANGFLPRGLLPAMQYRIGHDG